MSPSTNNHHPEHPNTYFVQDQSNKRLRDELTRLDFQSKMLTAEMGGVLSEQANPDIFHQILDLGSGTGDWLIEVAKAYPALSLLMGIEINPNMIEYAQMMATRQGVNDRVRFQVMDVLKEFELASEQFDLVNQRLGHSYIRTWEWPSLLSECQRVSKPGGTIRLTEVETVPENNSPAVTQLGGLLISALYEAGHSFTADAQGITSHLGRLLQNAGLQHVQTRVYTLNYRGSTVEGERFAQGFQQLLRLTLPFVKKWVHVPEDYDQVYAQAVHDMQQPDFVATWKLFTVWGTTPEKP
jgi:ubiquinone/menaquinone biosynthesis C-methylase UbiE